MHNKNDAITIQIIVIIIQLLFNNSFNPVMSKSHRHVIVNITWHNKLIKLISYITKHVFIITGEHNCWDWWTKWSILTAPGVAEPLWLDCRDCGTTSAGRLPPNGGWISYPHVVPPLPPATSSPFHPLVACLYCKEYLISVCGVNLT